MSIGIRIRNRSRIDLSHHSKNSHYLVIVIVRIRIMFSGTLTNPSKAFRSFRVFIVCGAKASMRRGTNSQGNSYNTPGGKNSSGGSSYHCECSHRNLKWINPLNDADCCIPTRCTHSSFSNILVCFPLP